MAKKEIYNCAYLEVAIERPAWSDGELRRLPSFRKINPKQWISAAKDVADQIKRHVDGVSSITIEPDTDEVCEFCGYNWTEGDSPHNGGCCEKDAEVLAAVDAMA